MRLFSSRCVLLLLSLLTSGGVARNDGHATSTATFLPRSALAASQASTAKLSHAKTTEALMRREAEDPPLFNLRAGALGDSTLSKALGGAVFFALIENAVKRGLKAGQINYPAQLGACIVLFVVMCLTDAVSPEAGAALFDALTPGAALLAKWFPVFFIPGLALLPLSPSVGGSVEILKVIITVSIGLVFSMSSTVFGVATMRSLQGRSPAPAMPLKTVAGPRSKPFTDEQWEFCLIGSFIAGILSIAATQSGDELASPLQMIFTLFLSVSSYMFGTRLPAAFTKLVHPLVTTSVVLLSLIKALSAVNGQTFLDVLRTYKTGSLHPMKAGAGDYLLYILSPAVVSFAVSVYNRKTLLFQNLPMVLTAMIVSSAGGLFATGAFVRAIQLGGKNGAGSSLVRLSVLARNVTTALAMALTDMIGGNISIAAAVVCLTGILGASYGVPLLDAMGIKDPIVRGLGIGSSSIALGVNSISGEPDAFAFASVALVMTAVAATTMVSFPSIRDALIRLTTGQASLF